MIAIHHLLKLNNLVLIFDKKPANKNFFPKNSLFIPILFNPSIFEIQQPERVKFVSEKYCVYDYHEHLKNLKKLKRFWERINRNKQFSEFEYWFFTNVSCIFHFHSILKKVFQKKWDAIYLPESKFSHAKPSDFASLFFKHVTLNQIIKKTKFIKFYIEKSESESANHKPNYLALIFRILSFAKQKSLLLRSKLHKKKVVVFLQYPKQLLFLQQLSKKYNIVSVNLPNLPNLSHVFDNLDKTILFWLRSSKKLLLKEIRKIAKSVCFATTAFFTDSEALPSVRIFVSCFRSKHNRVFTLPEGAQTVSAKLFPLSFFWWSEKYREGYHFVTSLFEKEIYSKYLKRYKTLVTGYFGGTFNFCFLSKKIAKCFFNMFCKKCLANRPNILFAIYGTNDSGSQWFGLPTQHQQFIAHYKILKKCENKNINIICLYQDSEIYIVYKKIFPKLIHIPPGVPWQLVERFCDLLVVRDSSLVLEFLARGCSVICFENINMPTISQKLKGINSKNLFFSEKNNIVSTIKKAVAAKKDSFYKFEKYFHIPLNRQVII